MRLSQIVTILKNTELKQIVVGEDDEQIISLLNLGLIDVYARFQILQEEQIINIIEGKTLYRLQDNSEKVLEVHYTDIDDSNITGNDQWNEAPVNDVNHVDSVFTPQPYYLHIPNPKAGRRYSVMNLVCPPYVTLENIDTLDFVIPPQLMEPIVNYVGYRAYKSMNGDEKTEISSHLNAYENSCMNVYRRGLINISTITNLKAKNRGFA